MGVIEIVFLLFELLVCNFNTLLFTVYYSLIFVTAWTYKFLKET